MRDDESERASEWRVGRRAGVNEVPIERLRDLYSAEAEPHVKSEQKS